MMLRRNFVSTNVSVKMSLNNNKLSARLKVTLQDEHSELYMIFRKIISFHNPGKSSDNIDKLLTFFYSKAMITIKFFVILNLKSL